MKYLTRTHVVPTLVPAARVRSPSPRWPGEVVRGRVSRQSDTAPARTVPGLSRLVSIGSESVSGD